MDYSGSREDLYTQVIVSEQGGHTLGQTAPGSDTEEVAAQPRLYLLFECNRLAASSATISLTGLDELAIGRGSQRSLSTEPWRLSLPDRWLSAEHARLQASFGRWILHDCGSKNGCLVNGENITRHELRDGDLLELGRSFFVFREHADAGNLRFVDLETEPPPITLNSALAREVDKLDKLAQTDIPILLLGDSGSGKEVLAQRIHKASSRPGQFVAVNCGALPAGLIESELFGHKKGSFSGAVDDHKGLVRSADHGTLFLDEIADLPSAAQATMLRVLQEREVRAVGATKSDAVNVRSIAATHLDLDARVESGEFRRDLFARIAGYRVTLPALEDRREDLGLLIAIFIKELGCSQQRFSVEAARALLRYHWPLNIRELRSCLATSTVLADGGVVELEHLPEAVRDYQPKSRGAKTNASAHADERTKAELLTLLAEHGGNISAVARDMSKDRKQIQRWLKRFQIDIARFR